MGLLHRVASLLAVLALAACKKDGGDGAAPPPAPVQILFPGLGGGAGNHGIFDPSIAFDASTDRLWMSYSEVVPSPMWPGQNSLIQTRLARSDDRGASWSDAGVVPFPAQDVTLPLPSPNDAGTWVYEVSTLAKDPAAFPAERWLLMCLRYLLVNGARRFEHGWIALKTAPDPMGPWSAERKLFAGSLYDPVNDTTLGPPEVRLNLLHAELNAMLLPSEPGLFADATGLYLTLLSAEGSSTNGRIILLRLPPGGTSWQYLGSFLVNAADGPAFGVHGFSAPALYEKGGSVRLIATPQTADFYSGTRIFNVTDLATATLERVGGVPVVAFSHDGTPGSFNGAAAYAAEATGSGLLISEAVIGSSVEFRIFATGLHP